MTKGIYCYYDINTNEIVYIGKDSHIDKKIRHKQHYQVYKYHDQKINKILQKNQNRYNYKILWEIDNCTTNHLNQMEIYFINKYHPRFNFSNGGDGFDFGKNHPHYKSYARIIKGGYNGNKQQYVLRYQKQNIIRSIDKKYLNDYAIKLNSNQITISEIKAQNYIKNKQQKTQSRPQNCLKKISETRSKKYNITGFYQVCKHKNNKYKKGFRWCYRYYKNGKRCSIESVSLIKLEQKVKKQGLEWRIVNQDKAQQSLLEDEVK